MKKILLLIQFLLPIVFFGQVKISYPELVNRMIDLEYLATIPLKGEFSGNFSSYDRKSKYDSLSNTYKNWDANADGTGYVRNEDNDIVVFEKDGPGVIWRFWSALALSGKIKIYVDHDTQPIIDQPFAEFFELLDEEGVELPKSLPGRPSINLPELMSTLSRGRNRFIPIPFKKHCKIVFERDWGMYYHITYSLFPEGKYELPEFKGSFSKKDLIALAETDRILYNRGFTRKKYEKEKNLDFEIKNLSSSGIWETNFKGSGAINHFNISFDKNKYPTNERRKAMLEDLWIQMTWDGDKTPSVSVPFGMFFGTFPDFYPNRTLPVGTLSEKFYSNWYMPFSNGANFKIINKGENKHNIKISIAVVPLKETKNLLRFHAKWHKGKFIKKINNNGRDIDWPILITRGKGRYCGMTLHIQNEWEEPKDEAVNWWYGKFNTRNIWWWWGEGDEKFYVDGEKFPSTYGTGSEDYVGYAWSAEPAFALFDHGFASQPYTAIDGNGHTIVSRFHIGDNIPFQKSFTGVIEKYKADKWGDKEQNCSYCPNICLYQAVAFWYLMPGQSDIY